MTIRPLAVLAAAAALAAPATAPAADRPEWTDCKITSAPKRFSMQKAFTRGIPVTFTCRTDVEMFLPLRIDDPNVRLSDERRNQAIGATKDREVKAGAKESVRVKVAPGWPRQVMRRHAKVRVLLDIAADRGDGMFSNSDYGRYITLVR